MPNETDDRILPKPGEDLPLAEPVQRARAALAEAIACLREFQQDTRYPVVTRSEVDGVITAIEVADDRAARLDPPFVMKT
jgi:hypothetical protein